MLLGAVRALTRPGRGRPQRTDFGGSGVSRKSRLNLREKKTARPALPNLRALADSRGGQSWPASRLFLQGVLTRLPRSPPCWSGPGPRHAQPSERPGPAPALRLPSRARRPRASAPLRRRRQVPRSPAPRVLLLRRGHPGEAGAPRARLPAVLLRLRRCEHLVGSLRVSRPGAAPGVPGHIAARRPGRGAPPAVPPAPCAGAAPGSPLRPPGLRRRRYEVPRRPRPGKQTG